MRFLDFARVLEQVEATRSRRAMVTLVAGLFSRCRPGELAPAAYLLQGRLAPPYEGLELGAGDRMLLAVLARWSGTAVPALGRRLARTGDLGLVAEGLARGSGRAGVTLTRAYRALLAVARTSGAGSVERKVAGLCTLLRRAGPIEARYMVRIAAGRLRLGAGDQTLLEAGALAFLGARERKPLLEQGYNVRADLGAVLLLARRRGAAGLTRMGPLPGVPVRPALAQRLASPEAIIARLGAVQVEPKYDGLRLQLHRDGARVRIFSRRLEDLTAMFPELVTAARRQLRSRRVILEGEAVAVDPETGEFLPFQVTMTRKRKSGVAASARKYPLRLFAFDLLYTGRTGCLDWPQARRSRALRRLVRGSATGPIVVTEAATVRRAAALQQLFEAMIGRGLEGVVAKRPDAPYRADARGFDWVKLKRAYQSRLRDTVDLVLVGYFRGRGRRAALGIGSVLAAAYDPARDRFRTVARIGSGLSDPGWRALRRRLDARAAGSRPRRVDALITPDVWVAPGIVVEVLADEITRSPLHSCGRKGGGPGYGLRFPRVVGERPDKAPEDATTEAEIVRLHRLERRTG